MLTVAITGGIGSGKSTVADLFKEFGIDIIDADVISHEITYPGHAGYTAILDYFGADILQADETLDRQKLREIIFNDMTKLEWLESTLHPIIRTEMRKQCEQATSPYCIVVIPLLMPSSQFDFIDRILVVDTSEDLQIKRACQRDNSTPEQIQQIINAQITREERLSIADDIIINNSDIQHLKYEAQKLHEQYLKI